MQITPTPLPPIFPRILLLLTFVTGIVDSASIIRKFAPEPSNVVNGKGWPKQRRRSRWRWNDAFN